ncbi:MAG: hypothetical protein K2L21_02630 [Muribaculaceae bacterium]|nr:hypothetical protein [Muribaculaceae bacterium]
MNTKILACLLSLSMGASYALTSCSDVDDPVVNTAAILKEVTTGGAEVTATSATVTGTVKGLAGQSSQAYTVGVVYGTNEDPTAAGSRAAGTLAEDGTVTTTIKGLTDNVTYYYATFVTLQGTVTQYGEVKSFITTDAAIATADAASVKATSAILGGTVNGMQDELAAGLVRGFVVAPAAVAIENGAKFEVESAENTMNLELTGLVPNTAYHYAAFMTVNGADVLAADQAFTTPVGVNAKEESLDDYVDMGTRLEWCRYNVGAAVETEAGTLLGYGDVTGFNYSVNVADYAAGDITGTDADVAKAAGMGMIPTAADWADLMAVSTVTAVDGGLKVTSNVTGNSIILPAAGKREGTEVSSKDLAMYWTGTACATAADYATLATIGTEGLATANALRYTGALVRPVRKPYVNEVEADVTKLAVGDIENNGRIRIEIYNEYGKTSGNPAVDLASISFEKQMVADFTLSGINGNLKEGAVGSYRAGFEYSDPSWAIGYWSSFDGNAQDCLVTGDGDYRVCMNTWTLTEGAIVFCIDIQGLGADLVDIEQVKVENLVISLDPAQPKYAEVDTSVNPVWVGNKEDNGTDIRVEFYNEYGPSNPGTGDPYADVTFGQGTTVASLHFEGIDGNLKAGAAGSYTGSMSLAIAGWWPSWWGGGASDTVVTGDGDYNFPAYLEATKEGTVVWCVDIAGLYQDLVDPAALKVTVNSVITPVHAE